MEMLNTDGHKPSITKIEQFLRFLFIFYLKEIRNDGDDDDDERNKTKEFKHTHTDLND